MRLTQCVVKNDGLLYLTVPIGLDIVVYNLHRRYGPLRCVHSSHGYYQRVMLEYRLPHLIDGWQVEHVEGWNAESLDANLNYRQSYEPVFVLRNSEHTRAKVTTLADHGEL